jgi:hypothetical protein
MRRQDAGVPLWALWRTNTWNDCHVPICSRASYLDQETARMALAAIQEKARTKGARANSRSGCIHATCATGAPDGKASHGQEAAVKPESDVGETGTD